LPNIAGGSFVLGWLSEHTRRMTEPQHPVAVSAQTDQVRRAATIRLADRCLALSVFAGIYAIVALLAALVEARALPDSASAGASATLGWLVFWSLTCVAAIVTAGAGGVCAALFSYRASLLGAPDRGPVG
jgi:hypothetical protein